MMRINILIVITLLTTNLSAWSICSDDKMYKGKRTYGLLMAGTGSNENFLNGATCFQSPVLSHLEETITIIQDPKKGPAFIRESDAYKTMIKEARTQCIVSMYSTPCKMYQVAIAIVETTIKQQDDNKYSNTTSKKINNIEKNIKLKILRNLPYAKRGYIFKSKNLMNFYKTKKWYKEDSNYQAKVSDLTQEEQQWRESVLAQKTYNDEEFFRYFNIYTKNFINTKKTINDFKWLKKPHIVKNIKYKDFLKNKTIKDEVLDTLIPSETKGQYIKMLKNGDGYFLPNGKKKDNLIVNSENVIEGGILYMEFLDSNNKILESCYEHFKPQCIYLTHWSNYKFRIDSGI